MRPARRALSSWAWSRSVCLDRRARTWRWRRPERPWCRNSPRSSPDRPTWRGPAPEPSHTGRNIREAVAAFAVPFGEGHLPSCRPAGERSSAFAGPAPAQEDVGRALGHALADDDPLSLVIVRASARHARQHRLASFTCRNKGSSESSPSRSRTQQPVPTLPTPTTLRADVDHPVARKEPPTVFGQRDHVRTQQGIECLSDGRPVPQTFSRTISGASSTMRRSPFTSSVNRSRARM